jgi:hypothetical protein
VPNTSSPNPNTAADRAESSLRALAAVQIALDRRDNGGDAARDADAARAASA